MKKLCLLLFVVFLSVAHAQKQELGAMLVLQLDHREVNGHYIVTTKAVPILDLKFMSRVTDPNVQELAPMEKNTWMLCHSFVKENQVWFRCGSDEFVMQGLNFTQEK